MRVKELEQIIREHAISCSFIDIPNVDNAKCGLENGEVNKKLFLSLQAENFTLKQELFKSKQIVASLHETVQDKAILVVCSMFPMIFDTVINFYCGYYL